MLCRLFMIAIEWVELNLAVLLKNHQYKYDHNIFLTISVCIITFFINLKYFIDNSYYNVNTYITVIGSGNLQVCQSQNVFYTVCIARASHISCA